MSKKCYRFFGGLLTVQKNWLNKMAEKGYRLIRTGKLLYEFEKCKPGQVQYCVEFIGQNQKLMLKITMISWKKWDIPYSIKISILIILLVKFAGVRGLKLAVVLQQTLQHLTGNC